MYAVGRVRGSAYFTKTVDRGETWISYDFDQYVSVAGLTDLYFFNSDTGFIVGSTNIDHEDSRGIVLKTTNGGNSSLPTYVTTDGGETWNSAGFGSRVNRLEFIDQNIGYACGETIYKYIDALSIGNEKNVYSILPNTLVINYPNPFNLSTTILTYIPESGLLQVSVIDLLGRNIRTLYDEKVYE